MAADWLKLLETQFRATPSHSIYVLGCFAKSVTLYSQQVRGLNLVYGLSKTRALRRGQDVAIIGAGAAGLTAAVAAAYRGAKVTVFDELAGPMQLQQNNRQRWIHPFIYEWPYENDLRAERLREGDARLPLLSWTADYAANVARRITSQWEYLQQSYRIEANWCVRDLRISCRRKGAIDVSWNGGCRASFSLLILALGFGLEPKRHGQDSYWAEDDLDGSFRKPRSPHKWLLSGGGDGALTDLMRLSIHRFRQDEILSLFVSYQGIDGLKSALRTIQSRSTQMDAQQISKQFDDLSIDEELKRLVLEQLRKDGPKVVLVTQKPTLYDPRTSILNRLVLRILNDPRRKTFEHQVGRVTRVSPGRGEYRVRMRIGKKSVFRSFDRVLLRHGPKSKFARDFPSIHRSCNSLKSVWENLSIANDITRYPAWTPRFFGPGPATGTGPAFAQAAWPLGEGFPTQDPDFEVSMKRFGLRAERVTIIRRVRSDGSSHVTYAIDGLSVLKGHLDGMFFRYTSGAGTVDRVKLLAPRGSGLRWIRKPEKASKSNDPVVRQREKVRVLSGEVRFSRPLRPSQSFSFALSFRILNGDALSDWEFRQMYEKEQQRHMDGELPSHPMEYMAWYVLFPVRVLRITVSLPTGITHCAPSVFLFKSHGRVSRRDIVKNHVLLNRWPTPFKKAPQAIAKPLLPPHDRGAFQKSTAHGWNLSVPRPLVGSCYSLDWRLPSSRENGSTLRFEKQARHFREILLRYGERLLHPPAKTMLSVPYQLAHEEVRGFYGSLAGDEPMNDLKLLLMVYSEKDRCLRVVDGFAQGKELDSEARKFWLPFGLGLGGSCFKSGNRIFLIDDKTISKNAEGLTQPSSGSNQPEADPGFFLKIPGRPRPKLTIQVPVDSPYYKLEACPEGYEPSRQSVGVIGIDSPKGTHPVLSRIMPPGLPPTLLFPYLQSFCQRFCNELYRILVGGNSKARM